MPRTKEEKEALIKQVFPKLDSTMVININPAFGDAAAVAAARAYAFACQDYDLQDTIIATTGDLFAITVFGMDGTAIGVPTKIAVSYIERPDKLVLHYPDGTESFLYTSISGYRIAAVNKEQIKFIKEARKTVEQKQQVAQLEKEMPKVPEMPKAPKIPKAPKVQKDGK